MPISDMLFQTPFNRKMEKVKSPEGSNPNLEENNIDNFVSKFKTYRNK